MPADANDEVKKFWSEKEASLGGKVLFNTYAALVGECGSGKPNGRGGLCYIVGDRIYFEDFEKHNALMAILNRKDTGYEKTVISFLISDVIGMRKVSEKWGRASIAEGFAWDRIPELKGLSALFVRGYWLIELKDRPALIMEIMDDEGLRKFLP